MGSACSCSKPEGDLTPPITPQNEKGAFAFEGGDKLNGNGVCNGVTSKVVAPPASNGEVTYLMKEADHLMKEVRRRSVEEGKDEQELLSSMSIELSSLVGRLESAVSRLEVMGASGNAFTQSAGMTPTDDSCTVPFVVAYDQLMSGPFKAFLDNSATIGEDVAAMAKLVQSAFKTQRAFLVTLAKSKKPSDTDLPKVLEPTGKKIQEVIEFRERKRTSPHFHHLSAVSESIPGLSWVAMSPTPGPFVSDMGDAATFYTNRVLKDFKEKDKIHVEWVKNWNSVFKELQNYIKAYHTTGVTWNARGGNALSNLKDTAATNGVPPAPPACGIPPPPPVGNVPKAKQLDEGKGALFADINKGTDITSHLKRVDDELKTHKNPSLREGPKPFVKIPTSGGPKATVSHTVVDKPPRMVLEGKKWFIEYQKDNPSLILTDARMDQCIYIYRCSNTVVQIKNKVNSVIMDSCKKSSVVFDSLVSACEIVNCQSCQMQAMGKVPTVSIEKTDGAQIYLNQDSLGVEIITAKSSEMNIMIPSADGDFTECPVPEQFKTVIVGNKLSTVITEKAG